MRLGPLRISRFSDNDTKFELIKNLVSGFVKTLSQLSSPSPTPQSNSNEKNPLEEYFQANLSGPGIVKWMHYFQIYDAHLSKFRGTEMAYMEIGIYSGGTLGMWQEYFGNRSKIYGVDIDDSCLMHQNENVKIFIGDQADRSFWRRTLKKLAHLDVVIDDGGHEMMQQIVSFEEIFPSMNAGGVYIVEDIHGPYFGFHRYISELAREMHQTRTKTWEGLNGVEGTSEVSSVAKWIHGIHIYPLMIVIERNESPLSSFELRRRGDEWSPIKL